MNDRYYVDERTGCIAVRDRTLDDPDDNQGLHANTPGVVWFSMGSPVKETCAHCGHTRDAGWNVDRTLVMVARDECDRLNAGGKP